jgi:hypothetical protein
MEQKVPRVHNRQPPVLSLERMRPVDQAFKDQDGPNVRPQVRTLQLMQHQGVRTLQQ